MSSEGELLRQLIDNMTTVMARVRHLEAREVLGTALCGMPIDCSKGAVDRDMWVYDAASSTWLHVLIIEPDRIIHPQTLLTIAGGEITASLNYHRVDTEGGAAADDLDTINGGIAGAYLLLQQQANIRDVTVKHGTDNIRLSGAADFMLDNIVNKLLLIYSLGGRWEEVSRSINI